VCLKDKNKYRNLYLLMPYIEEIDDLQNKFNYNMFVARKRDVSHSDVVNIDPYINSSNDTTNNTLNKESDIVNEGPFRYAITLNFSPNLRVNKRPWKDYTQDQQRASLGRIEAAFRRRNPTCKLIELRYEVCPKIKQIHFHALYEMPLVYKTTMSNYYAKFDATLKDTRNPWRHLDIQDIFDNNGWIDYCNKDNPEYVKRTTRLFK